GVRFEAPGAALSRLPPHYRHMLGDALAAARTPPIERVVCAPAGQPGHVETLRQYVGAARVTLPGAAAVVRDVSGRGLAIRRGDLGTWDMPGGWCELGET